MTVPAPELRRIQLHDSMRRKRVELEPLAPGRVGLYVCGPTPYAPAHIGHAYSAIAFDTIRRGLEFLGYQVRYVRNITDVEDKIIRAGNERGEDPMALAARYTADYNRDMARFGVRSPDVEPKVSTHMPQIIAVIERLIANGCAYPLDGDVYFSVASFEPYGQLMYGENRKAALADLRAGERVAVDERKRDPADFALWKAAKPGEPWWDSPWGKGRPGWHIECSAMCSAHLGETFDLHGGGKDLTFPHHENEIAQSQAAYGPHSFARYWLHNGFINFGGEKMSKSLGNVFGCGQIADAVGGEALRFFCVSHHYRSSVDFDVEEVRSATGEPIGVRFRSLEAADRSLEYFYTTLHKIDQLVAQGGDGGDGPVLGDAEALIPAVRDALADDFNTPVAVAAIHAAGALANRLLAETKGVDKQVRRRTLARLGRDLRIAGAALGILETAPEVYLAARRDRLIRRHGIDVARVAQLVAERAAARAAKDFARSDALRGELGGLGVDVLDSPQGTSWSVRDAG